MLRSKENWAFYMREEQIRRYIRRGKGGNECYEARWGRGYRTTGLYLGHIFTYGPSEIIFFTSFVVYFIIIF